MDIYERLAVKLDELPNGFPRTETGLELRILRKIFLPEEAEVAIKMSLVPEAAAVIAKRVGKPDEEMGVFLDNMVRKGQIGTINVDGERRYSMIQFTPGIYESQRNLIDKELADLYQEYYPILMKIVGGFEPAFGRVTPVGINIPSEMNIHRSDDIRRMIDEAVSFNLRPCFCRKSRRLAGFPCKHKKEIGCLVISKDPNAFEGPISAVMGKNISREEALKVLADAEEEGFVHCTDNISDLSRPPICSCCSCCCVGLRAVKNFNAPHMLAKSAYLAKIDQDSCTGCGICKDERCPMDAIAEDNGCYTVIGERCIGCGVCTVTCPTKAITLEQKSESAEKRDSHMDWCAKRAKNRGVPFPPATDPH